MSTYKIYSAKDNNAKNLGIRNSLNFKLILILLPLIGFVIAMINKIFHYQLKSFFWIVYIVLLLIVIGYSLMLINNLKQIGTISFYNSGITKKIGDFTENWPFDEICGVSIKSHMRDLFFQKNKFGIRSYFLELQLNNSEFQRFVVSSISMDNPEFGLVETLTALSKTQQIELKKI